MKNFRIKVDPDYLQLIGRATYTFSYLEWQIIYVGEKLKPGFLRDTRKCTAGQIANRFENLAKKTNPELRSRMIDLSSNFKALVIRRNHLIHANPITDPQGEPRLHYSPAKTWQEEDIVALINDFELCAADGNNVFYKLLV